MNNENRRAHALNPHILSKSQEQVKQLEPLKVNLPTRDSNHKLSSTSRKVLRPTTNIDRNLQSDQTGNLQQKSTTVNPPRRKKKESSSNLVNDRLVPQIIKDKNRKVNYNKHECVGLGGFAKVYRVTNETGKEYAVKVIAKASLMDSKRKEKLIAEINIHRSLCHEYIVQYQSCFEDKYNVYIILEYCKNATLNNLLSRRRKLTEDEVRYFMGQILSAVRYISDNKIVHRDIKLGNIFLDENMDCKIGDFGLSARLIDKFDRRKTTCGTPHYIAPEILFDATGHNHRADMWSAGVLMYILLFGKHPFHHDERKILYQIVRQNQESNTFSFPSDDVHVSKDAKDLISSLLVNDPDLRLTVTQALNHSFFTAHKIPEQMPKEALYKQPSYNYLYPSEYNNTSSQSKVADSVRQAGDANESYVDHSIKPPLELLREVILDHRTHFPIKIKKEIPQTCPSVTTIPEPSIPNLSLKSKTDDVSLETKRTQPTRIETDLKEQKSSVLKMKADQTRPLETKRTEQDMNKTARSISYNYQKSPVSSKDMTKSISENQIKKPIMEEMAENLKIMLERRREKSVLCEKEIEGYRGRGKLGWGVGNVFIQSWLDSSKKYGFCYCLSDNTLGALYNDGSTLTTHDEKYFYYIHQENTNKHSEAIYAFDQFPAHLEKKRWILKQFKCYMINKLAVEYNAPKAIYPTGTHVMKYAVDKDAISFKLNNGVVQFNFFNHKKLVMYEGGKKLIYIDENKNLSHHHTVDALYSDHHAIIQCLKNAYHIIYSQNELRQEALRIERWKRYEKLTFAP
ncbi:hypothetical protein G6F43_003292 [Rhizopus delemar]|nr:hypothetical protein G6F43_003292 [Rhizopus delemar]